MEKRGLSAVITTLIIILLSLIVIVILWLVISKFISEQSELTDVKTKIFSEQVSIEKVSLDENQSTLTLNLRKSTGTQKYEGTETITFPSPEVDIISIADLSGSMRACHEISWMCCYFTLSGSIYSGDICYGIEHDKIDQCVPDCGGTLVDGLTTTQEANKQLVETMFEKENENRLGLVAYSDYVKPEYSLDLTNDVEALNDTINSWEAEIYTCVCCGINEAKAKLEDSPDDKLKTIIVMSDGEANRKCSEQGTGDAKQDAIQAACDAYNELNNLTIHAVSLGDEADLNTMSQIAECGHGENFSATNVDEMISVYKTIGEQTIKVYQSVHAFNYIKIVFYTEEGTVSKNIEVPDVLDVKTYEFDLPTEGITPPILKIEIYPVVVSSSGKETVGNLLDSWRP